MNVCSTIPKVPSLINRIISSNFNFSGVLIDKVSFYSRHPVLNVNFYLSILEDDFLEAIFFTRDGQFMLCVCVSTLIVLFASAQQFNSCPKIS